MNLDELKQSLTEAEKQAIIETISLIVAVAGTIVIFGTLAILLICIGK